MSTPALELTGISKSYPGVKALSGISMRVMPGEVHALLGENGAGKSTLLKILNGVVRADAGTIAIDGVRREIDRPKAARAAGLAMIHQELQLVPDMDVAQNLFLGSVPRRWAGLLTDRPRMEREARRVLGSLGASIDPSRAIRSLSVAQRQLVEIARALLWDARIVAMDEPTSALSPHEFEALRGIVREIARQGVAVIYVSHKLDEVFGLCRNATVLRDGRLVAAVDLTGMREHELVSLMVGRELDAVSRRPCAGGGETVLKGEGLVWKDRVRGASLEIRRGEILGVAGLVGAGRTELVRLLAGLAQPDAGRIVLHGHEVRFASPRAAIRAGIALLPEDRKKEGIIPLRPVVANVALPVLGRFARWGLVGRERMRAAVRRLTEEMQLRPPSIDRPIGLYSGGNQQKAIIARWLLAKSDILIFDEPTRGIDVGAKSEIYRLIERLADEGRAIVVVSSELPEIIRISDRVLVMCEGRLTAELGPEGLTENIILSHAVPGIGRAA
jgi:ribose transport system ATP-binding protein